MKKLALLLILLTTPLAAQHITGSIGGTVTDQTGAVVVGVGVTLTNTATTAQQRITTDDHGNFEFLSLVPGNYELSAELPGFKRVRKTELSLSANQRLSTGPIVLEVGDVDQTVTVSGKADVVQTASAERSGTVSRLFIDNLQSMSRDPMELIQLLPGFTTEGGGFSPIQAPQSMREFSVNGGRRNNKNFTLDGMTVVRSNSNQAASVSLNMDAVEQVQVQLSNYQAEYGRTAGPAINVITRSGSQQFHGNAYFYIRNEALNANDFFNNKYNQPRQRYRYRTQGFTVGGPLYIPGLFNTQKNKLFFFFSESQQPASLPPPLHQITMPTEIERKGDFSQTVDQQGKLIAVKDPLTGKQFPNNIIPANRLNEHGVSLLDFFPIPNFSDPQHRFNYQKIGVPYETPRREEVVKIDYNLNAQHSMYVRYAQDSNDIITDYVSNYSAAANRLSRPGKNLAVRATQVITPQLVNEVTFGYNRLHNDIQPENDAELAKLQRSSAGVKLGQFNKSNNPDDLIPNLNFGALLSGTTAPSIRQSYGIELMQQYSVVDNISRIMGQHIFKAGIYHEITYNDLQTGGTTVYAGALDFSRDSANPNDTGYPYANAALGYFRQYQEISTFPVNHYVYNNLEWFLQDTWKMGKKLTLDYGLRFYWHQPEYETDQMMSNFDLGHFDIAKAPRLYAPYKDAKLGVVARDPLTGSMVSKTLIGAVVPGTGDSANGLVLAGKDGTPQGLADNRGVHYSPRFGFAYDPFGDGKTAVRGGFGILYDRIAGVLLQPLSQNPPAVFTPTLYYGNLDTFLSTSGVIFPQTVNAISQSGELPTVMNFSLGVQRQVSNLFVMDIAYVGSLARHLVETRDYNTTPFGTNFKKQNEDPTASGKPLRATFLRPYQGFDAIRVLEFSSNSSYHSLQLQVQRRFGERFNVDASWTWSKAMVYADTDGSVRSSLLPGWRDYGKASLDTTHMVNVFYVYQLPSVSRYLGGNAILSRVLDDWRVSGITRFSSGLPMGVSLSAPGVDFTGSTEGARVKIIGNPILPRDQRTFSKHFNTAAIARPTPGVFGATTAGTVDYGDAPRDVFRGPGINNWNLSVTKDFRIRERHRVSLGSEFFNAFNHTQFRRLNTTAQFNAAGQQTNPQFGEYNSTNGSRVIQLWLRYSF